MSPSPTAARALATTLALALSLAATRVDAQAPEYATAWAESLRLERAGLARDAAVALEPAAVRFADDYELALRLGWLRFEAHDYELARIHYAHALRLSDRTSTDARLGLGWTLLRMGRPSQAQRQFDLVLARAPENRLAREGLAALAPSAPRAVRVWASLDASATLFANTPARSFALSAGVQGLAQLGERVLVGASYRLAGYDFRASGTGNGSTYLQHEAHAQLGYVGRGYDVRAHFGYLADTANPALPAWMLGASANVRLLGVLHVEGLGAAYRDTSVFRLAASWQLALHPWFTFGPTASAQYANGTFGGSIGARVAFTHRAIELALAGRYASEFRPTDLNAGLTYATNNVLRGALSLGGRVPLGASGLGLTFGYEWLRMGADGSSSPSDFDAHQAHVGLTGAF